MEGEPTKKKRRTKGKKRHSKKDKIDEVIKRIISNDNSQIFDNILIS